MYEEEGEAERKQAELAAVKRIFCLLPTEQAESMLALWLEFEQNLTPEARFAHAMDRLMPVLLNLQREGQSWRENGIRKEQVFAKVVGKIRSGSDTLGDWISDKLEEAATKGYFG